MPYARAELEERSKRDYVPPTAPGLIRTGIRRSHGPTERTRSGS